MKILIVGDVDTIGSAIQQMIRIGHLIEYAPDGEAAKWLVEEHIFDLVVFVECEHLEETDLIAEELKSICLENLSGVSMHVFVLWDPVCGFDTAHPYGLRGIDILIGEFSIRIIKEAYKYVRDHNL